MSYMTSKQALESIKHFVSCNHPQESVYLCDTPEYKEIEKDLEILERYKNIEEKLGISIATLIKAVKNGIYDIEDKCYRKVSYINSRALICEIDDPYDSYKFYFLYKDYGLTWALTREELE